MPLIFKNINWIDIFFIILLVGIVYKGLKTGVGGQIVSLIGQVILVFVSIGYYDILSKAIFGFLLQNWAKPVSFFIITIIFTTVINIIKRITNVISQDEELAQIEKVGGVIIATLRASILFGLIGMFLLLIPIESIHQSAYKGSQTCMFFVRFDAKIYEWLTEVTHSSRNKEEDKVVKEFVGETKD